MDITFLSYYYPVPNLTESSSAVMCSVLFHLFWRASSTHLRVRFHLEIHGLRAPPPPFPDFQHFSRPSPPRSVVPSFFARPMHFGDGDGIAAPPSISRSPPRIALSNTSSKIKEVYHEHRHRHAAEHEVRVRRVPPLDHPHRGVAQPDLAPDVQHLAIDLRENAGDVCLFVFPSAGMVI